jgi:hypothetical protein
VGGGVGTVVGVCKREGISMNLDMRTGRGRGEKGGKGGIAESWGRVKEEEQRNATHTEEEAALRPVSPSAAVRTEAPAAADTHSPGHLHTAPAAHHNSAALRSSVRSPAAVVLDFESAGEGRRL